MTGEVLLGIPRWQAVFVAFLCVIGCLTDGCGADDPVDAMDAGADADSGDDGDVPEADAGPVLASTWSEPEELPFPVNAGAGWTDMPAIDPTGDGLWFVYWNGEHLDSSQNCDTVGETFDGYYGELFDIVLAPSSGAGFERPVVFDPEPRARYAAPIDQLCLGQSSDCGCFVWGPTEVQPGCADETLPCSSYEGCRAIGSEGAVVRSFDGQSLYFSREELELNEAGRLAPNMRLWVGHPILSDGLVTGWHDPVRLPETINAPGIRVDTPTISPDNSRLCFSRAIVEEFDVASDSAFELWCADRADPTDDQDWGPMWPSALNQDEVLDYQPMFTAQGVLLFTTTRGTDLEMGTYRQTVHYAVPVGDDYVDAGIFPALTWYDSPRNNHREGASSLSADGRTFYFLRGTGPDTPGQDDLCRFGLRIFRSHALD